MKSRKNLICVKFEKRAEKEFKGLSRNYQEKISAAIDELRENPLLGEPLSGEYRYLRRLRVGVYRIIYHFNKDVLLILVLRIGHRKDVYHL
jgi:mRNA interferase RelE/StbE